MNGLGMTWMFCPSVAFLIVVLTLRDRFLLMTSIAEFEIDINFCHGVVEIIVFLMKEAQEKCEFWEYIFHG